MHQFVENHTDARDHSLLYVTSVVTKNGQDRQRHRQNSHSVKVLGLIIFEFEVCMVMRSSFKMDSTLRVNTR
jgi:hypothetical protein